MPWKLPLHDVEANMRDSYTCMHRNGKKQSIMVFVKKNCGGPASEEKPSTIFSVFVVRSVTTRC